MTKTSKEESQLLLDGWHRIHSVTLLIYVIVHGECTFKYTASAYCTLTSLPPPHCRDSLYRPYCMMQCKVSWGHCQSAFMCGGWGRGSAAAASSRPWRTERGWMSILTAPWMKAAPGGYDWPAEVTWLGYSHFLLCSTMRHAASDKRPLFIGVWRWKDHESKGGRQDESIHESGTWSEWERKRVQILEDRALKLQQSQQITSMNEAVNRPCWNRKCILFFSFIIVALLKNTARWSIVQTAAKVRRQESMVWLYLYVKEEIKRTTSCHSKSFFP